MIKKLIILLLLCPVLSYADNIDQDTKNIDQDTKIAGRVFTESGPMPRAQAFIYEDYNDIKAGKPFAVSVPADEKGVYKLQLPPGEYYFTARGEKDGKEFFAYHGNNPIKVERESLWIALMVNEVKPPAYSDGEISLKGIVTYKGSPVKDAYVALYVPEAVSFKGLGARTESVNNDGTFDLSIPAGKYVVIAKKMQGGKRLRPLKKGDLYCYYPHNPVEVKFDKAVRIEVPCYPKADSKTFAGAKQVKSKEYVTLRTQARRIESGIRGRITDVDGNPVPGMFVLAYRSKAPVFLLFHASKGSEYSGETDKDGNYFIPIDSDGDFHIVTRNRLGRAPRGKDLYGIYDGSPDYTVHFKKDQIVENIDIMVGKKEIDAVRREALKEVKDFEYRNDYVIDRDTLWRGNITINGRVSIKRGATLLIDPGTVVRFNKLDRDNNNIGDGEIMVQGRIIARGTKDSRIIFESADKNPGAKDWSYILLLATGGDSVFEYCEFRHAFSGLQAIYSSVSIKDCLFEDNDEGIRLTRSDAVIRHNSFLNNHTALRHTIIEGWVFINNNIMRGNDIGVLFRQSQINTVDFEIMPEVLEQMQFRNNNIYNNHKYNIQMGDRQFMDVDVVNNWWGSEKKEYIEEFIFDKKQDSELGQVVYSPYLSEPVPNAGVRGKL